MQIERKAQMSAAQPPLRAKPAACLDCPDCRGTCWDAVALRMTPDMVLHLRDGGRA
jgi:hypothetical protein